MKMKVVKIVIKMNAVVKNQQLIRYLKPKSAGVNLKTASENTIEELLKTISIALA
jgi:hypothetical protein